MPKPIFFVSSTCFDLKHVRESVKDFIESIGGDAVLSEDPGFGVTPGMHSHQACIDQVARAHYLILIIGGRRGGTFIGSEASITNEEYKEAHTRKIPIFTFVEQSVWTARSFYSNNPAGDFSKLVDDVRIFDFLDRVRNASEDNFIKQFSRTEELITGLRGQLAHILLLYSENHVRPATGTTPERLSVMVDFPRRFQSFADSEVEDDWIVSGLRKVHRLISSVVGSHVSDSVKAEILKMLWVMARYNNIQGADYLRVEESIYRMHTWASQKGRRVNSQASEFGIRARYETEQDDERQTRYMEMSFKDAAGADMVDAIIRYVGELVKRHGEDGIAFFRKGDMTCLT